jgi:hypothetical protein
MRVGLLIALLAGCSFAPGVPPGVFQDAPGGDGAGGGDGTSATGDAAIDAPGPPPSGITCPGQMCGAVCCDGLCVDVVLSICQGRVFRCDGPEDCAPNEACCNDKNGSYCTTSQCNGNGHFEACHTTADCSTNCNDCSFRSDYGQKVCCE